MPVSDATIDRALSARTKPERDAAIRAMLREWLTTMPSAEKEKMRREMVDGTLRILRGLQALSKRRKMERNDLTSDHARSTLVA